MAHRVLALCLVVAGWAAGADARLPRADDPDHVTPADQQAMLALVRRAATGGELAFSPDSMPAKLLRATGRPLVVSAHRPGAEPVVAWSARGTLFEQLKAAGAALRATGRLGPLAEVRLKLDLVDRRSPVGPALPLGMGGPPVLGVHGLRVRTPAADRWLPGSEALRLGLASGEAFVRHALGQIEEPPGGLREVRLERFTATSFIEREPGGGGPAVALYRGMPRVGRVSRRRLLAAAEAAGDWLLRVQKPDGSFHYIYDPVRDRMGEGYNVVRHAGVSWSLVQAFEATGRRRFLDGAGRALGWLLKQARTRGQMSWLEHDGRRPLGAAALGVMTLLAYREAAATERFDAAIGRLGAFLVFMQRPDGFFHAEYDADQRKGFIPEDHVPLYAAGEALVALVRLARAMPGGGWRQAAAKGADFAAAKRDGWFAERGMEEVYPDAWTMMALDELHALGAARRAHVDYAFFLARLSLGEQAEPGATRWLDHVGAPRAYGEAPRATPAACRCEGLLAAWRLARRMGVATGVYRRAVLRSLRFQLAHQYDAVNSYLLPNPSRALGGFYASYADHRVRIDTVQHNLSSLVGAARMLEAEQGD